MSKNIDYLIRNSKIYGLVIEYINDDLAKIYSSTINEDSWLVKDFGNTLELWHMSKKNKKKNCSYHLQIRVKRKWRKSILKVIRKHNKFKYENSKYKGKNLANLVDRVLERNKN